MLGFWYNDLTRAQDGFKVALVELRDADIYYVYSLADFSFYCGYSLVAAGLGIDRNLVLEYGRTSAWRLNFKNQTYPSNPGVNPDLIRPKTKINFHLTPNLNPLCTVDQKIALPFYVMLILHLVIYERPYIVHTCQMSGRTATGPYLFIYVSSWQPIASDNPAI